jgi:hypothetical protein
MNGDAMADPPPAGGAAPRQAPSPEAQAAGRKAVLAAVVLLVLVLGLSGLLVWFLAADAARAAHIRDIVVVLVVLLSVFINIAIGGVLILLIFRLQDLTKVLRDEIQPTLADVSETVRTVTGTARMVSEQVARPTIKAAGFIAGVQGIARAARRRFDDLRGNA